LEPAKGANCSYAYYTNTDLNNNAVGG